MTDSTEPVVGSMTTSVGAAELPSDVGVAGDVAVAEDVDEAAAPPISGPATPPAAAVIAKPAATRVSAVRCFSCFMIRRLSLRAVYTWTRQRVSRWPLEG